MKLYDGIIEEALHLLVSRPRRILPYDEALAWPETTGERLILRRDTACEPGSGTQAVGALLPSARESFVWDDRVECIGPDIPELSGASGYARLTLVRLSDVRADHASMYHGIRDIDFAKYAVHPDGFTLRVSPKAHREQACVDQAAFVAGISFGRVGMNFIRAYKRMPLVRHVRLLFVTDPAVDYAALSALALRANDVTKAMNRVLDGLATDCATCDLKVVCDAVEGMRALHFGQGL